MPNLLKKLTLSFLAFLVLFFSVAPSILVRAQETSTSGSTWYNQSFQDWYGKVYDINNSNEIFGERYTAAQVQWVFYGVLSFIINQAVGVDNAPTTQCFINNFQNLDSCKPLLEKLLSADPSSPNLAVNSQSTQNLWSLVFATDRPFSGISYVKEKIQNFSLVPVAHAQTVGFGFSVLQPIQDMWKGVRDISFGLFVLAAIVLAFMIMFRVKISPQVVISVQSAIPKVVIALVLVTFSYAIAGFMVDLMYVVIGVVSVIASKLAFGISPPLLFSFLTQTNIFYDLIGYLIALILSFIVLMVIQMGAILAIGLPVGAALVFGVSGGTLAAVFGIIVIILAVIIVVSVAWITFKTVWALIKAFANVLLLVIFGPLQIVAGVVIPNFGFSAWFKNLASALSTFVVTGVLMLFSIVFLINGVSLGLQNFIGGSPGQAILNFFFGTAIVSVVSGTTSAGWPPLLGGGNSQAGIGLLFLGVSLVLFTMIPKATELVQSFISGKPFAYGSGIGDVSQGLNWVGSGAEAYAFRRKQRVGPGQEQEAERWGYMQKAAEVLQSFTRQKH
jgi:hypothetical protein